MTTRRSAEYMFNRMAAVTPSDDTTYDPPVMALFVTATGQITCTNLADVDVNFGADLPVGAIIWGPFKQVKAATTATVVGYWNE